MLSNSNIHIPQKFICPITCDIMIDPVLDTNGYTYERSAIEEAIKRSRKCPLTNVPYENTDLLPNIGLRNEIQAWKAKMLITALHNDNKDAVTVIITTLCHSVSHAYTDYLVPRLDPELVEHALANDHLAPPDDLAQQLFTTFNANYSNITTKIDAYQPYVAFLIFLFIASFVSFAAGIAYQTNTFNVASGTGHDQASKNHHKAMQFCLVGVLFFGIPLTVMQVSRIPFMDETRNFLGLKEKKERLLTQIVRVIHVLKTHQITYDLETISDSSARKTIRQRLDVNDVSDVNAVEGREIPSNRLTNCWAVICSCLKSTETERNRSLLDDNPPNLDHEF